MIFSLFDAFCDVFANQIDHGQLLTMMGIKRNQRKTISRIATTVPARINRCLMRGLSLRNSENDLFGWSKFEKLQGPKLNNLDVI